MQTELTVYPDAGAPGTGSAFNTFDDIRRELAAIGVDYERWSASAELPEAAEPSAVLAAYDDDIQRLKQQHGFKSVDVVSMHPNHPDRAVLRQKFLAEHTHSEHEVRFFVDGAGLFLLHAEGRVYRMLCVKGDLITVPAGLPHWFDMGASPSFTAIRLFTDESGWVANFTGSTIADRFPLLDSA